MGIGTALGGLFSFLGSGVKAFFGFKQQQADLIGTAVNVISDVNRSTADREAAVFTYLAAEATSQSWLTRSWRPIVALWIVALISMFLFGYTIEGFQRTMPPLLGRFLDILEQLLLVGIPARSFDKMIQQLNIGMVLRKFIEKKLM